MKKVSSILVSILIVLAGLHPSVATHFCRGRLAQVKVSVTEEKASCGMECTASNSKTTGNAHIKKHCCEDYLYTLSVDDTIQSQFDYNPDTLERTLSAFLDLPQYKTLYHYSISPTPFQPPPKLLLSSKVDISFICIYRS